MLGLAAALAGELVGNVVPADLGARQVDPGEALGALDHGPPRKGLQAEARDEVVRVVLRQGPPQRPALLFFLLGQRAATCNGTQGSSMSPTGRASLTTGQLNEHTDAVLLAGRMCNTLVEIMRHESKNKHL